jgi:hypothetical protein
LDQTSATDQQKTILHSEPLNAPTPDQYKFRTGVSLLVSEEIDFNKNLSYHQVSENQFDWLNRVIDKGVAITSEKELSQFFNLFGKEHNNFQVLSEDGLSRYYRIHYSEPPIDITKNYVYVYEFDQVNTLDRSLDENTKSIIAQAISDPYHWIAIDDVSSQSLNSKLTRDGSLYKTTTENGDKSFRLTYVGKYSEDLTNPEIRAMYNVQTEGVQ